MPIMILLFFELVILKLNLYTLPKGIVLDIRIWVNSCSSLSYLMLFWFMVNFFKCLESKSTGMLTSLFSYCVCFFYNFSSSDYSGMNKGSVPSSSNPFTFLFILIISLIILFIYLIILFILEFCLSRTVKFSFYFFIFFVNVCFIFYNSDTWLFLVISTYAAKSRITDDVNSSLSTFVSYKFKTHVFLSSDPT